MATNVVMPQMGYDMREGTVSRWLKREGDSVARGEVIAEIETDKAMVDMESYAVGVLGKIVVEAGRTVPVGEVIAVITEPGEAVPSLEEMLGRVAVATSASASVEKVPESRQKAPKAAETASSQEVRASPIARRLAREKGLELAEIEGTGPGGRVTEADVTTHEERAKAAPVRASTELGVAAGERVELTRMRQAIARVTSQSKREAPHFYVTSEIDMTQVVVARKRVNESLQGSARVSINDILVKAAAEALVVFPKFNASFQGDHLQLNADVNIGIAISLDQGLIVPVIGGCQSKSLLDIASTSRDLIQRARSGTLRADEYGGGTFSISNLGMFDVDSFAAIIYPPNAAVLAVATVKELPVVRDGEVTIAPIMKATLSVDHRVADGVEGARFLMELKRHLESPTSLMS